jgi:hypothetical protein
MLDYSIRLMKTNCAVYCRTSTWFGSAFYIELLANVLCVLFNDAVIVLRLYSNSDIRISMEHWWNNTDRGNLNTPGGCPSQILHGLAWDRTWACAVRGQQPTD